MGQTPEYMPEWITEEVKEETGGSHRSLCLDSRRGLGPRWHASGGASHLSEGRADFLRPYYGLHTELKCATRCCCSRASTYSATGGCESSELSSVGEGEQR